MTTTSKDSAPAATIETLRGWALTFGTGLAILGAVLFVVGLLLFLALPLAAWFALIAGIASAGVGGAMRAAVLPADRIVPM